MKLDVKELALIRHYLQSKKMYRNSSLPLGAQIWEPWMEDLLKKINYELMPEVQDAP